MINSIRYNNSMMALLKKKKKKNPDFGMKGNEGWKFALKSFSQKGKKDS